MPRITLPDPQRLTPEQQRVYDAVVAGPRGQLVGPLRAVLLVPELAHRWQLFGEQLRYKTSLPARITELAIVTVARHWNSQIEWQIHAQAAAAAGVPENILAAIRLASPPSFEDVADADAYEYTRQLLNDGDVSEALHAQVCDRWGPAGIVELTAVIGYYTMVSMMLNAQAILPSERGDHPLPPVASRQCCGVLTRLPPAA